MNNFKMSSEVLNNVISIVIGYITKNYIDSDKEIIIDEIEDIFSFEIKENNKYTTEISYEEIQKILSGINEKSTNRKNKGVYYTPHDLVKFITINLTKLAYEKLGPNNLHDSTLSDIPVSHFCYEKTIFDPTCGAGEFLLVFLDIKLDLLDRHNEIVTIGDIAKVLATIHGNDINIESIIISKLRLLLSILNRYGVGSITGLSSILNENFTNSDYVTISENNRLFDIIVGNPPYVEDSKSKCKPQEKYGNIYANVLVNSSKQLKDNGVFGYVIPLSYISTPRMGKLRDAIDSEFNEQFILSYSDRPDCLFTSVHQKLNVLFARKSENKVRYTSNYQYWYKEERNKLFNNIKLIKNSFSDPSFIPKIGSVEDVSIFKKVYSPATSIIDYYDIKGQPIYLNMRATYWIKAFIQEHLGAEYKKITFNEDMRYFMMCIFNSSLFWWYWICVSDCWHITKKELSTFKVINEFDREKIKVLALKLEDELEKTKVYVGTKQTQFEYKHKKCIDIIYEIDDYIAEIYGLTENESAYIKNFNLRYRQGGGAI